MAKRAENMEFDRPTRAIREQVSAEEWAVRVDLAACYRLLDLYGMTDMINNHVTARVPGNQHAVLINGYGFLYDEICASNLYKINLEGDVLLKPDDVDYGVNPGGYVIHSAIHAARPDAGCVLHTHTRASMAVSAMKCGLLPITQTAMWFYDGIAYHDFEGPVVDLDEQRRLVDHLGSRNVMLLRNHGTITIGRTVSEAFVLAYLLELACQTQVDAMNAGVELITPPESVAFKTAEIFRKAQEKRAGSLEWSALLRRLDRIDPSYAA